jgi:hypothetical protein
MIWQLAALAFLAIVAYVTWELERAPLLDEDDE